MRLAMISNVQLPTIPGWALRPLALAIGSILWGVTNPAPAKTDDPALDRVIVPGERVGKISWNTDEASLIALFGRENVLATDIDTGEGDSEPGTVIFPGDDSQRLSILWEDNAHRLHPRSVEIYGTASRWKTDKGITLGTNLKELERLNTMPFRLSGFGHDGSGTVFHCGQGVLKELGFPHPVGNGIDSFGRKMWISLNPYGNRAADPTGALYKSVSGDSFFASDNPAMQALNPVVDHLTILLKAPEETSAMPPLIVAFGDSTTAPREVNGEALQVYADRLREKSGKSATVFNAGVGGNDTGQARARFETDVLTYNPDVVIIQFGLNDSCIDVWDGKDQPRVTQEAYAANLRYFVETLQARGCAVILMTANPMRWTEPLRELYGKAPFDVNDPWGFNLTNREYAKSVRALAQERNVPLVDVYQRFFDYGNTAGQAAEDLLLDGMHPTNQGHSLIAQWLWPEVESILKSR